MKPGDPSATPPASCPEGATPSVQQGAAPAQVLDGEAAASAALDRAYLNGWLARGKKDAAECDAVTERYAPGGKGSPIPTTWPEVASRMCADRIRALAPPSAPPVQRSDEDVRKIYVHPACFASAHLGPKNGRAEAMKTALRNAISAMRSKCTDMSVGLSLQCLTTIAECDAALTLAESAVPFPPQESANDDRLLLLKALLTGEVEEILFDEEGAPEADLYWQNGERETVKIDSEGFPILTDSLRAALTEATHG